MVQIEVWKDIKGFEGLYQVSNKGRVRSIDEYGVQGRHLGRPRVGSIMALTLKKTGYINVRLSKNGKAFDRSVHRLVAVAFLLNPNNYPCINHKDGNRQNNCVDNLEWCTYQYNNTYDNRVERSIVARKLRKVKKYTPKGAFVEEYRCCREAAKKNGLSAGNLYSTLHGRQKTCGGYKWEYSDEALD